jgi:haloacetate dehalogenase
MPMFCDSRTGYFLTMFDGFLDERIAVGGVGLRVRHGGEGRPILLVHGHPRTGATWHRVAERLVRLGFTVVCPDMRGYGASDKVPLRPDHSQQSKRAVAQDLAELMRHLGHQRFAVAGHDRGCYVALRLALDHHQAVSHLVAMDGVPISEALARCDAQFAHAWYHWFFFAQPDKPERAIMADPEAWYRGDPNTMGHENYQEFRAATSDPATVQAMLEDYRAGLGVDRDHEETDRRTGRTVQCPTLVLWSTRDDMEDLYGDPVPIWQPWTTGSLQGASIESGHHMAEENPTAVVDALHDFVT